MKRILLSLLLLMLTITGCKSSPRVAWTQANTAYQTANSTLLLIIEDCEDDPNDCLINNHEWHIIMSAQSQTLKALEQWKEAIKNNEPYWNYVSIATHGLSIMLEYVERKD